MIKMLFLRLSAMTVSTSIGGVKSLGQNLSFAGGIPRIRENEGAA
jgi:hypothetical protein